MVYYCLLLYTVQPCLVWFGTVWQGTMEHHLTPSPQSAVQAAFNDHQTGDSGENDFELGVDFDDMVRGLLTPHPSTHHTLLNIITRVFRNLQISSVIKSPRRSRGDFIHWKSGNF